MSAGANKQEQEIKHKTQEERVILSLAAVAAAVAAVAAMVMFIRL